VVLHSIPQLVIGKKNASHTIGLTKVKLDGLISGLLSRSQQDDGGKMRADKSTILHGKQIMIPHSLVSANGCGT